jgi:hypothetical protein
LTGDWVKKSQDAEALPAEQQIAIVGMSGGFPSGSDIEVFWDVLQRDLDMHKEVGIPIVRCLG